MCADISGFRLKLLKISLVKFTYPAQCPKVPPLPHFSWCGRGLMSVAESFLPLQLAHPRPSTVVVIN